MLVRRLHRDQQRHADVVWFGSYGLNPDGTAKFFNTNDKHDNYAEEKEYVADSLQQKMSILKGECWFDIDHGLPLFEKPLNKLMIDIAVTDIINRNYAVKSIIDFNSNIDTTGKYNGKFSLDTIFGDLNVSI